MIEKTAVFFDIDGTLLDTHGAGRDAFVNALKAVLNHDDDLSYIHFAGTTDLDVFNEIRIRSGLKINKKQEKEFFDRLPVELGKSIRDHLATLCPGVRELLEILSSDERAVVGLVTGNTEECAHIKLSHFNLHGHFVLGAFGKEHARRPELARRAKERAQKYLKRDEELGRCFLIGGHAFRHCRRPCHRRRFHCGGDRIIRPAVPHACGRRPCSGRPFRHGQSD